MKKFKDIKQHITEYAGQLTEGKMGELSADIGDHMDKHINHYNKFGGVEHLMYQAGVAAKKIAKQHKIKTDHAHEFVRDYMHQRLNEDVDNMASESVQESDDGEYIEEMTGAGMSARAIHKHLKTNGWSLTRTSGGHDVFTHPKSNRNIAVPRHKGDLKAPTVLGILKSSKISEEIQLDEGRPSQAHPLEGHDYHKKTDAELNYKHFKKRDFRVHDANHAGMVKEEAEQIEELSKSTLGSYIRKASGDAASATRSAGVEAGARGPNRWAKMDAKEKRAEKRLTGISKAVDRLTKEEAETILEYESDLAKMKKADSYKVGDKVYVKAGGRWNRGVISKPKNSAGNHGVKFKYKDNKTTTDYLASSDELRLHVEEVQLDVRRTSDIVKDAWKSAKSRKSKDVEAQTDVESKDDSRKDTFQKDPEMTGEIAKQ